MQQNTPPCSFLVRPGPYSWQNRKKDQEGVLLAANYPPPLLFFFWSYHSRVPARTKNRTKRVGRLLAAKYLPPFLVFFGPTMAVFLPEPRNGPLGGKVAPCSNLPSPPRLSVFFCWSDQGRIPARKKRNRRGAGWLLAAEYPSPPSVFFCPTRLVFLPEPKKEPEGEGRLLATKYLSHPPLYFFWSDHGRVPAGTKKRTREGRVAPCSKKPLPVLCTCFGRTRAVRIKRNDQRGGFLAAKYLSPCPLYLF